MKITEHTHNRLVVESKPRGAFGIAIVLGALALLGSLYSLVVPGDALSKDITAGLILGPLFLVGGVLLYRETTTVLDKTSGKVTWEQRGLVVSKAESARLDQVRDVVVGRAVSEQSGGAKTVALVLDDRTLPLMFGFSATTRDVQITKAVKGFLDRSAA